MCEADMENATGRSDATARLGHLKLVVLGATGATGLEVARQATERGHSVTAFVRAPDRLGALKNRIAVKKGDLLDSSQLANGIEGHDAVISAFGPRLPVTKADEHLLQQFATALTKAMEVTRVRRVVVESVAFLFKDSIIPPAYLLGRLLFPSIVADSAAMERIFDESGLDWTMVRPPELTNKPYTGKYRVTEGHLPRFGFKVSRSDVADFMIRSAENHSTIRKIFGVSQ
jgi:putative NADH-flavin reductase